MVNARYHILAFELNPYRSLVGDAWTREHEHDQYSSLKRGGTIFLVYITESEIIPKRGARTIVGCSIDRRV